MLEFVGMLTWTAPNIRIKIAGKTLADLQENGKRYPVALVREGNEFLPEPDLVVQENDRVIFNVSTDQISRLDNLIVKHKEG